MNASKYYLKCFFSDGTVTSTEGFSDNLDLTPDNDFIERVLPALKHYVEGEIIEFKRETIGYDHIICYRPFEYFDHPIC